MSGISADIFRAYDVRGVVGTGFDAEQVFTIGRAIADLYPDRHRFVLGRDGRLSGKRLLDALADGLNAGGADTADIGIVPTPALYYTAGKENDGTGLMVTGSHNPPEYNGIKMMIGNETLAGEAIQAIYRRCTRGEFGVVRCAGTRDTCDGLDDYTGAIVANVKIKKKLRVVVDCGNGSAGPASKKIFDELTQETKYLYCDIDGHFPNHHPNPSEPANLDKLRETVVAGDYDAGLAFDGDGDRLGVVDNLGRIIWPDRQVMVFARDILRNNEGATIIYDVKSSRHLADEIRRAGGRARMCRTGHSFVKGALKETGALLAGEMSGHIFFNDRWPGFDDGLYAAARLLEILSQEQRTCAQVFDALPPAVSTPEINIEFGRENMQHEFMRELVNHADFGDGKVITVDGLRVEFDDGWGLVRASNTTSCLVTRFEADNEEALARIQRQFHNQLKKISPDMALPF